VNSRAALLCLLFAAPPLLQAGEDGLSAEKTRPGPAGDAPCPWEGDRTSCFPGQDLTEEILPAEVLELAWVGLCNEPGDKKQTPASWTRLSADRKSASLLGVLDAAQARQDQLTALLKTNLGALPAEEMTAYSLRLSEAITWFRRCAQDCGTARRWLERLDRQARSLWAYALEISRRTPSTEDRRQLLGPAMRVAGALNGPQKQDPLKSQAADGKDPSRVPERGLYFEWLEARIETNAADPAEDRRLREVCSRLMRGMLEHAPMELLGNLARANVTVMIIPAGASITDLPAFKPLAGAATHDGRSFSEVRGLANMPFTAPDGSPAVAVAVGAENLAGEEGPADAGYLPGQTFIHEFAHAIHLQGLPLRSRIAITDAFWHGRLAERECPDWYACTTEAEYFAQLSGIWFSSHLKEESRWSEFDKLRNRLLKARPELARLAQTQARPVSQPGWVRRNEEALYGMLRELYGPPRRLRL